MTQTSAGQVGHCRFPAFVGLYTLANLLLFGWPLYAFAVSRTASWPGAVNLIILTGVQAVLMVMVLSAVSILSLKAMKAMCIALLIGNALALYFITTYHVLLDKTMMGNVFDTDRREAYAFFQPTLFAYLLLLGVFPAWLVSRLVIVDSGRLQRLGLLAATGIAGCLMVYAGSSTWRWFDLHAKTLGGLMLPWSYLANGARQLEDRAERNRQPALLPPLHFIAVGNPARKTIVVLVIGESARADNFSIYGYGRQTNPELARTDVIALPDARACATYTTAAIRCMLSPKGSNESHWVMQEALPSYLQRHGVEVLWRSNNGGEPPLRVGLYQHVDAIRKGCAGTRCAQMDGDEALLDGLREWLVNASSQRLFVVLHQAGSHGPNYDRKVPRAFVRFQPVCGSVDPGRCSQQSLVNAYDNTIVYTDHVVAEAIRILQSIPDGASTLIYLSDHGESLGEHGVYLHGAPTSIAPDTQRKVPFLLWMSPGFRESRHLTSRDILARGPFGDDNIFHTVLGAFGGRSAIYNPRLDLFNPRATATRPSD